MYWKKQYESLQQNPSVWVLDADCLVRSFNILARQDQQDIENRIASRNNPTLLGYVPSVGTNAMMLGALAVEVLIKAIALSNSTILEGVRNNDKDMVTKLWRHDICNIANLAGFELADHETKLCQTLECFLKWAGRYSTPKKAEDIIPRTFTVEDADGVHCYTAPPNLYSTFDYNAIRRLTQRLRDTFPQIPRPHAEE